MKSDMDYKYLKEAVYGNVKVVENKDGKFAVVDLDDNFGKYDWIDGFDHGLARVRIGHPRAVVAVFGPEGKKEPWRKWGIINKQGIEVLPVIYDNIWNFLGKNRLSTYVESKERGGEEIYFHDLDSSVPYPTKRGIPSMRNANDNDEGYGQNYGEFTGSYAQDVMGYSDDVINDAFEGDPDNYWNID